MKHRKKESGIAAIYDHLKDCLGFVEKVDGSGQVPAGLDEAGFLAINGVGTTRFWHVIKGPKLGQRGTTCSSLLTVVDELLGLWALNLRI